MHCYFILKTHGIIYENINDVTIVHWWEMERA